MFRGFPFGFGGMPGGMPGGMRGGDEEPADTTKLYELLGVEKSASKRDIKRAYFKLAREHHPDRGGDEEKFKDIQKAYEILGDESKREIYDKYGEKAVDQMGARGRGGQRGGRGAEPSASDITAPIDLNLRDICRGTNKPVKFEIKRASSRTVCSECNGKGMVVRIRNMGGMMLQMQQPCTTCRGAGISFDNLQKVSVDKKLNIPKGTKTGDKIKLAGEGHDLPGMARGDVVFVARVAKDSLYVRTGADLNIKKQITLRQALCGYEFSLEHPSGTTLKVRSQPGEIVKPGQLKRIAGWGVPQKGAYDQKGHMYIKFEVLFPTAAELKDTDRKAITAVLDKLQFPKEEDQKITLGIGVAVKLQNLNEEFNGVTGKVVSDAPVRNNQWVVELNGKVDKNGDPQKVAVPEKCLKIMHRKNRQKAQKAQKAAEKAQMDLDSDDDREPDEEIVKLTDIDESKIKRTPAATNGAQYEDDEDDEREGGVQCQQM